LDYKEEIVGTKEEFSSPETITEETDFEEEGEDPKFEFLINLRYIDDLSNPSYVVHLDVQFFDLKKPLALINFLKIYFRIYQNGDSAFFGMIENNIPKAEGWRNLSNDNIRARLGDEVHTLTPIGSTERKTSSIFNTEIITFYIPEDLVNNSSVEDLDNFAIQYYGGPVDRFHPEHMELIPLFFNEFFQIDYKEIEELYKVIKN
jgi:hypothetical protein